MLNIKQIRTAWMYLALEPTCLSASCAMSEIRPEAPTASTRSTSSRCFSFATATSCWLASCALLGKVSACSRIALVALLTAFCTVAIDVEAMSDGGTGDLFFARAGVSTLESFALANQLTVNNRGFRDHIPAELTHDGFARGLTTIPVTSSKRGSFCRSGSVTSLCRTPSISSACMTPHRSARIDMRRQLVSRSAMHP